MQTYIVVVRRKHNLKPEIVHQGMSEHGAEGYAQDLYYDLQLDMVMVVGVREAWIKEGELRYYKVMKIERTCKHPNVQAELFLREGRVYRCVGCGMEFKPRALEVLSNIEQTNTPSMV